MPWRWPKRSRLEQDGGLVRQPGDPCFERPQLASRPSMLSAEAQSKAAVEDEALRRCPGINGPLAIWSANRAQKWIVAGQAHSQDVLGIGEETDVTEHDLAQDA